MEYTLQEPEIELLPSEARSTLTQGALERRPDLKALDLRVKASEIWVKRARSELKPRIMAAFSGGIARFAQLTAARLLFGGFALKFPLFNGGRLRARIEEAERSVERAQARREELELDIRLQVEEAQEKAATAREAIEATGRALNHARRSLSLAWTRYRTGLGDYLEVVTAESGVAVADSDNAGARYDYQIALAELERAVGRRHR